MCHICERENAEKAAAEAARRAAEPRRTLQLSEILRGEPCFTYSSRARERFAEAGSVEVTVSLAVEQADDWDWYWAASRLLTEAGYDKFSEVVSKANRAHEDAQRPYRELLNQADQDAIAVYDRVKQEVLDAGGDLNTAYATADKEYIKLRKIPQAALEAVRVITAKARNAAYATAFAEVYISEEGTTERTGNDRYYSSYDNEDEYYEDEYYEDDTDY
jgi:hypothetical protein